MRGILGADIFINLLLVFIITTGLLLMNTNKGGNTGEIAKKEKKLLKIDLPKGSSKGLPGGKPENMATLSAKYAGKDVQYFMDNSRVKFTELTKVLKSKRISSVSIRFDKRISYGSYINVLDICKQAGIKDITNVYTKTQ